MIRQWRGIERWIESGSSKGRATRFPLLPLRDVLQERREPVQVNGALGEWQAITIKFSGEVLPRDREEAFKGAMFAAYPGDLAFSKIDARNGAVGLIPESVSKAVVTSEYPVFTPRADKLRATYLHHLLRADHFKADLQRKASGTSGRKRVTPEGFLSLEVPVPRLDEQDELIVAYTNALAGAAELEQEAEAIERVSWEAFESVLGLTPPPPLPSPPVFVARFKDVDRWSHASAPRALRGSMAAQEPSLPYPLTELGSALREVRHGCAQGPSKTTTSLRVLKISAVTKGRLDLDEYKHMTDDALLREQFALRAGDILMCRTNGTLAYVGMSAVVDCDVEDTIFPDKVIRVRPDSRRINPHFLWRLLQLTAIRRQLEAAARTAVGNFAIGGKDIKALKVPLPSVEEQANLVKQLNSSIASAQAMRAEAAALRASAWLAFESALFTGAEPTDRAASGEI